MHNRIKFVTFVIFFACAGFAQAEHFRIEKIQINGLKRIAKETVINYLPRDIKVGNVIDDEYTSKIIHALYKTNFFSDITVERKENVLVIKVAERATISSLKISGSNKISKQQLIEALKAAGIAEGQEFNPSILYNVEKELIRQYHSMGLHNAKIEVNHFFEDTNRVILTIKINEGLMAKIKSIKILENRAFSHRKLLNEISLSPTKPWSFMTNADKYSKEKLEVDLEKLRTYYMDRGYLKIIIEDPEIAMTPDKSGVRIKITVNEGSVYKFGNIEISGDLLGKRNEILKLVTIKSGEIFSLKRFLAFRAEIVKLLNNYGYAMAEVVPDYKLDEVNKIAHIKIIIRPNNIVYLRRISFTGNERTCDEVLRREMRFQEGGKFSQLKIVESARRLANLGYLKDVDFQIVPIPETNNQMDIVYSFKEDSGVFFQFQAGLSDREGFLYGVSIKDQNTFGTGKFVSLRFDNTKANRNYGISYHNPYFTMDEIGLSISGYANKSEPDKISHSRINNQSSYKSNTYGLAASFDIPISDYTHVTFGSGVEHIGIYSHSNSNEKMKKFIANYGSSFNQWKIFNRFNYSNLDRSVFPRDGFTHSLALDGYLPFNKKGLMFYKINYEVKCYKSLVKDFVFRLGGEIGYGDGIGRTKALPIFKNFFAGGIGSVRGFDADSIGSEEDKNRIIGGNLLTLITASIILPSPIKDTMRPSIFVDLGTVGDGKFKAKDLRSSYGLQIEWKTPLIPFIFSIAKPIHKKSWDNTMFFQFSIGATI